jgi:N-methylhydantoinase B/oxoprolinase/acetone carboxylase alpha subunit
MLGCNYLIRDGIEKVLSGKTSINVRCGDIISIHTPGGGGFGVPPTT